MICTSVGVWSNNTKGVCKTSSSMTGQSANSPARSTTSMNPVAGNTTTSDTTWPASQPTVLVESRPLSTTWSWSASSVTAPNSGCSGRPNPRSAASAAAVGASQ